MILPFPEFRKPLPLPDGHQNYKSMSAAYLWMRLSIGAIISDLTIVKMNYPSSWTVEMAHILESLETIVKQSEALSGDQ